MPRRLDSPVVRQVSAARLAAFFELRWYSCCRVSITNMSDAGIRCRVREIWRNSKRGS
jgi:hypothetical protein